MGLPTSLTAAQGDLAWPVLFEQTARDFELESLGGKERELTKPQTRLCAPTLIACEKRPASAEELHFNSECHVAGSKPSHQPAHRACANRS